MTIDELKALTVPQRFAAFVAWVGKQNPEHAYVFLSPEYCALGRFAKSCAGRTDIAKGNGTATHLVFGSFQQGQDFIAMFPVELCPENSSESIVFVLGASKTFGELHQRLLPFLARCTPIKPPLPTDEQMEALEARPLVPFNHV